MSCPEADCASYQVFGGFVNSVVLQINEVERLIVVDAPLLPNKEVPQHVAKYRQEPRITTW